MINSRERAESLRQPIHFDHRFTHKVSGEKSGLASSPTKHTKYPKRNSQQSFRVFRGHRYSFHIGKINISSHSGAQMIVVTGQANLHSEHLSDTVRHRLHVARGKLGLPIYLLDDAIEIFSRKRIDTDPNVLAQFDQTQPRFRNINAHPEMAGQYQRGGFAIRRQHVAHFHTEHLQNGIGWRGDLHFRELRVDIGKLCACLRYAHLGSRKIFLLRFRRAVGSRRNTNCASCASASWSAVSTCATARPRRAVSSEASSCTISSPSCKRSPSQCKIFSTRPPARGPTCASSTSMVPETALLRSPQPVSKISNVKTPAARNNCRSSPTNDAFTLFVPLMSARLREQS